MTDGKEVILEINDTASGLYKANEKQDMGFIRFVSRMCVAYTLCRDLVIQKLEAIYSGKNDNS